MTTAPTSDRTILNRFGPYLVLLAVLVAIQLLVSAESFPALLDDFLKDPIDSLGAWGQLNRRTHPLFTQFFAPLTNTVDFGISAIENILTWLPWYVIPAGLFALIARRRRFLDATVAAAVMIYPGLVGLWEPTLETLALMSFAVFASAVIGIPLGIWAAFRPRVEAALRPFLDIMQTVPAFVYFLPLLVLFGIGKTNGAIATIIYALPPVVRLTTLGIRQVPAQSVEASNMFGASERQTLFKVQIPTAMPTILAGLSQTIMMALGIVVLAALVAAGGLGGLVLQSLNQRTTGRGIAVGLAIVAVAMLLDRVGRSLADGDRTKTLSRRAKLAWGISLVAGVLIGRWKEWDTFPTVWTTRIFDPIDTAVDWAITNWSQYTRAVNDFVVGDIVVPVRSFLIDTVAWPVLIVLASYLVWRIAGPKLATFTAAAMATIGLIGMWDLSIDTVVQVMIGVIIAILIAVPLGIMAGRNARVEAVLGPILDGLQTIPSLVYIIPVVTLFTLGPMPGIIASVLYAIVPGVRITALGIQNVPSESVEASQTFGATRVQTMLGVRIPLAAPTIMAGINQVIMMVLAMVIIAGLVGGGALGFETVRALTRNLYGHGFEVGLSIALIAMVLDRSTQALAQRFQPPAAT